MERDYYLHLPSNYNNKSLLPLIIFLHGGGQNIKKMARSSLLNTLADKEGFLVAYPLGVKKHWNDGRGITYGGKSKNNVDDVAFIAKLIQKLKQTDKVNKNKIYVTGVSNGGMMTFRLGCELSHTLSAIAPAISNIPQNIMRQCKPKSVLSVLLMNGTKDPIVPWQGGTVKLWKKTMGQVVSTKESIDFWVKHNRCKKKPKITYLPNSNKRDKSTVILSTYGQCKNNSSVKLYTIEGGGHTLPGKKGFNMPRLVGEKNRDIEGMKVIVDFLLKH